MKTYFKPSPWRRAFRSARGGVPRWARWFQNIAKASGIYEIRSRRTGELWYVGESHRGRLARAIQRHFQAIPGDGKNRIGTAYASRYTVEIRIRVTPPEYAIPLQYWLIQRYQQRSGGALPRDNIMNGSTVYRVRPAQEEVPF